MSRFLTSAVSALRRGADAVSLPKTFGANGYCAEWKSNLASGLPMAEIESDLRSGAGQELTSNFRAAHSSSALAVNTFGWWRDQPETFPFQQCQGTSMRFEVACASGLKGTPPHLDVLAKGRDIVAIESKCTEWISRKRANFVDSYEVLGQRWHGSPWVDLMHLAIARPDHFRHLDVAQLTKHAFGLMHSFPNQRVTLVYLFWEPVNASSWTESDIHRNEIATFLELVHGGGIQVVAQSYPELWTQGVLSSLPSSLCDYLQSRYLCEAT